MMDELHCEKEQSSQGQTQTGKSPSSKHSYNIKHIDCHLQTWGSNTALSKISNHLQLPFEFPSSIFQYVILKKADLKPNKPKISPINDPHRVY